jgi:hypothetical protein
MPAIDAILAVEKPAFARAVRAIIASDAAGLTAELAAAPQLVRGRSEDWIVRQRAAEVQEVQSAIGASGELAGEVIGYDRKAEHCLREGQSVSGACL